VLGAKVVICDPGDPEAKGLVERANGYLETSFLPGRSFASPADFNAQLADWLALVNQRHRRVLGCAPADRIKADRAAMLPLPPVAPVTGWHSSLRLPRDHYVRLDGNDYSVHPAVVGRRVEVHADLERVTVHCDGQLVADHDRRWARHQTISDPVHLPPQPSCATSERCWGVIPGTLTTSSCAGWPTMTTRSASTTARG
jgi:transposase